MEIVVWVCSVMVDSLIRVCYRDPPSSRVSDRDAKAKTGNDNQNAGGAAVQ